MAVPGGVEPPPSVSETDIQAAIRGNNKMAGDEGIGPPPRLSKSQALPLCKSPTKSISEPPLWAGPDEGSGEPWFATSGHVPGPRCAP